MIFLLKQPEKYYKMLQFITITKWQFRLLIKYHILTVAIVVALVYMFILLAIPELRGEEISLVILFSDPTMLGFIFIGAIMLFEKSENTLDAQVVTPMKPGTYLWSKALALMIPALILSLGIAFSAYGVHFRIFPVIFAVGFASLIFTFLGLVGVSRVKSFNQYMLIIPLFLAPTSLPLLHFYHLVHWPVMFVIPTQSVLNLLELSRKGIYSPKIITDIAWLGIWLAVSYQWAKKSYYKYILR